jgi:rhodanese-related sulfurtransferase
MFRPEAPEVGTAETAAAVEAGALLVDVREQEEFEALRVPAAVHVPLGRVVERHDELTGRGRVYVICAVGGRSLTGAAALRQLGVDAVSVAGGTQKWALEGRPTVSGTLQQP